MGPKTSPLGPGEIVTVTAHGENGECTGPSAIPADAVGLSLNVTAIRPTSNTFLTFWGEGPNPGTSNLNPRAGGDPTPNAVNTPLSTVGTFRIYNDRGAVDVAVDVNGYYANHDHDERYSLLGHGHDDRYSQLGHGHDDAYARRDQLGIDNFAFSGAVNADGLTFRRFSALPPSVTPSVAPVAPGVYTIAFSGLSLDAFDPIILLTPTAAIDRACTVSNFSSLSTPDGIVSGAISVRCTNLVGVPTPTAFSFQIMV